MEISIIGSGMIGSLLTRMLTKLNHKVYISNSRGPETLVNLAAETGATPVPADQAVTFGDLIILSIPQIAVPGIKSAFRSAGSKTIIIDTNNYYPFMRDGHIAEIDAGKPESVWVQEQIGFPVIKAFNNIASLSLGTLGRPEGEAGRIALSVAGDEQDKKAVVMDMINQLGFDPVDGGSLAESWRQQPYTPAYGKDLDKEGLRQALLESDINTINSIREMSDRDRERFTNYLADVVTNRQY